MLLSIYPSSAMVSARQLNVTTQCACTLRTFQMKQKLKAAKARKSRASDESVEPSSGNVFADLGFRDAEERLLKVKLATKTDSNDVRSRVACKCFLPVISIRLIAG